MSLQDTCAVKSFQVHVRFFKYCAIFATASRLHLPRFFAIWPFSSDQPSLPFRFELYVRPPTCYVLRRRATCYVATCYELSYEHFLRAVPPVSTRERKKEGKKLRSLEQMAKEALVAEAGCSDGAAAAAEAVTAVVALYGDIDDIQVGHS